MQNDKCRLYSSRVKISCLLPTSIIDLILEYGHLSGIVDSLQKYKGGDHTQSILVIEFSTYTIKNDIVNIEKCLMNLCEVCSRFYLIKNWIDFNFKTEMIFIKYIENILILLDSGYYFHKGYKYYEKLNSILQFVTVPTFIKYNDSILPHIEERINFLINFTKKFSIEFCPISNQCFIPTHLDPIIFKEKWEKIIKNIESLILLSDDELRNNSIVKDLLIYHNSPIATQYHQIIIKNEN